MFLPVDVSVMVEMRRRAVANAAAKKNFSFSRAGGREISKASFGGNRSEAGRYAANIRWQGESVENPSRRSDVARAKLVEAGTKLRKALDVDKGKFLGRAKESLRLRGVEEEISGEVEKFFDDIREETLKAFVKAEANIVASLNGLDSDVNDRTTRYVEEVKKASKGFVALANRFEKELRKIDPNAFVNPDNPFGMEAKRTKNFFPQRYPRSLKGMILSAFDGTVRLIATDLEQVAKDVYVVEKASFGGDRSEAGRYAANIRWQGQTVEDSSLVGYSEDMDGKPKSELHILASKTDTRLSEIYTALGRLKFERDSFAIQIMQKAKGYPEPPSELNYKAKAEWRSAQESLYKRQFLAMTPEEQQQIINEAKEKEGYYAEYLNKSIERFYRIQQEIPPLQTEQRALDAIYREKGWQRFFLVTNTNGHVHRSMSCSTTYPTTEWAWLPHLSGLTDKEAVDDQGGILCTHCFPEAPSDYTSGESKAKKQEREKRAEEKKVRDAKKLAKKITADGSDVRLKSNRTKTDRRTGEQYTETTTISSITGAKEFLRDAMEFKRLPKPSYASGWKEEEWKDGTSGLHTDENIALIAGLLSEKTGQSVDEILDDAEKRARKYRGE